MTWEQIQTTLVGLAVTAIVTMMGRWFGVQVDDKRRTQLQWAIEQGVAFAQAKYLNKTNAGVAKKEQALAVAERLAPKAIKKLDDEQKSVLVDATYARMKASLPHPNTVVFTNGEDIPVDVVPLPPPSRVPRPT